MFRLSKPLILASCVLIGTTFSVTMLSGQVPAKKRQAAKKKSVLNPAPTPAPMPVEEVEAQPVLFAMPGTPEAQRLDALIAQVRAGLVPIARFGPPPQEEARGFEAPEFAPTQIVPQKEIAGEMLAFQTKLSPLFAATDPMPASRINHFAWLKAHPEVRTYGWRGVVKRAEVQADASVIVTIKFAPKAQFTRGRTIILDYVHEKYLIANGTLRLIDTDAALVNPAIQVVQSF